MPEQLIVLLGAGASFDCSQDPPLDTGWRPPLVTQLFDERDEFTSILGRYQDAQSLAPDLRVAVRAGAGSLEDYLREHVVNATSPYDQRRFRSIPLYLQNVLW